MVSGTEIGLSGVCAHKTHLSPVLLVILVQDSLQQLLCLLAQILVSLLCLAFCENVSTASGDW